MSSTNSGPSITTTPNYVSQSAPAGSAAVPFDPSSVAITGGTIGGARVGLVAALARTPILDQPALITTAPTITSNEAVNSIPSAWVTPLASYKYVPFWGLRTGAGQPFVRQTGVVYCSHADSALTNNSGALFQSYNDGVVLHAVQSNAYDTQSPVSYCFETDSPYFGIGHQVNASLTVLVDEGSGWRHIAAAPLTITAGPWNTISWGGVRKNRKYWLHKHTGGYVAGLAVGTTDTVTALDMSGALKIGATTDSYGQKNGTYFSGSIYSTLAAALRTPNFALDATGGTGYQTTSGAKRFIDRIPLSVSPPFGSAADIWMVAGGINDGAPAQSNQPYINAYYAALRAAQPKALILAIGPWTAATNNPTGYQTDVGQYLVPALQAAGGEWVYLNTLQGGWQTSWGTSGSGNGSWQTGTGKVTATNGTGNADFYISSDGTHPSEPVGVDWLASRVINAYSAAMRSRL